MERKTEERILLYLDYQSNKNEDIKKFVKLCKSVCKINFADDYVDKTTDGRAQKIKEAKEMKPKTIQMSSQWQIQDFL